MKFSMSFKFHSLKRSRNKWSILILILFSHLKSNDDDCSVSSSSNNSSSTNPSSNSRHSDEIKYISRQRSRKTDENEFSDHDLQHIKRKHKLHSTTANVNGKKIHIKVLPNKNAYEYESDLFNDELLNSKRHRTSSSNDYHSTLNKLHPTNETYCQSYKNEHFNYRDMTKLTNENLHVRHFRDCLFEQDELYFLNSVNKYLNQFRERLIGYFMYMKSNEYREHLQRQLDNEMEKNNILKAKVNCLENNIKLLLEDTINLLKLRTNELGIEQLERPVQLITYANDISNKHKELRTKVATLEKEIAEYDHENESLNFILKSIPTNRYNLSTIISSMNDNTYSTLLASMSRQTEQQENNKKSHPQINLAVSNDKDTSVGSTEFSSNLNQSKICMFLM